MVNIELALPLMTDKQGKGRGWKRIVMQADGGFRLINVLDQDELLFKVPAPFYYAGSQFFWSDIYLAFICEENISEDVFQRRVLTAYPKAIGEDWGQNQSSDSVPWINNYSRVPGTSIPGASSFLFRGVFPMLTGFHIPRPWIHFEQDVKLMARFMTVDPVTLGAGTTQLFAVGNVYSSLTLITDIEEFKRALLDVEARKIQDVKEISIAGQWIRTAEQFR